MIIKILGTGCKKCSTLYDNTLKALQELAIPAEVIKVEDVQEIIKYRVMATPGLVIDDEVVSKGKALSTKEIIKLLQK